MNTSQARPFAQVWTRALHLPDDPSSTALLDGVEPLLHSGKAELSVGEILKSIEAQEGPRPVLFVLDERGEGSVPAAWRRRAVRVR